MKKLIYLFLGLIIVACSDDERIINYTNNTLEKEWLYTHTALEATATVEATTTSGTTIVIPFTEDIFAFSDRPNREYKYISGDEFSSYWNDYDDANSFKLDPPNAVLTWVDGGNVEEVEVVITDADFDGNNVIYTIENSSITANQSFEDVSLFVDGNGNDNAVYVGPNNIVMASAGAVNNDRGNIGNVRYTVVDLTTLKFLIEQGDDVTKVVPSLVTDMSGLFYYNTTFNQDISTWDVSNVTDMYEMFYGTVFNQDISNWDVSKVTVMSNMFTLSDFNQDIGSWDVSKVTDMLGMFNQANAFNQYICSWDVSSVTRMDYMFAFNDVFNQPIGCWDVSKVTSCRQFSQNSTLTEANTPNFTNCTP